MLRWHSSNAFTLACSCFIFFPPPTTGLLPSIKMNTSSEAKKLDLINLWSRYIKSQEHFYSHVSLSSDLFSFTPFLVEEKKRKKKQRKHLWVRNDTFGIYSKKGSLIVDQSSELIRFAPHILKSFHFLLA